MSRTGRFKEFRSRYANTCTDIAVVLYFEMSRITCGVQNLHHFCTSLIYFLNIIFIKDRTMNGLLFVVYRGGQGNR